MKPKQNYKEVKEHVFYDVHMHAFNLSHAGLLAFINRFFLNNTVSFGDFLKGRYLKIIKRMMPCNTWLIILLIIKFLAFAIAIGWIISLISPSIPVFNKLHVLNYFIIGGIGIIVLLVLGLLLFLIILGFVRSKLAYRIKAFINTLSIFENDCGRQFMYSELDYLSLNPVIYNEIRRMPVDIKADELKKRLTDVYEQAGSEPSFKINDTVYKKVILTPLVMDFGYKGFGREDLSTIHYNLRPRKQVIDQTFDLFNGIKDYYNNKYLFHIFEIYPFLGINTKLYDSPEEIKKVLESKFSNYIEEREFNESADRYTVLNKLRQKFINESTGVNRYIINTKNFYFAGIKLYPPLSYDPWPDDHTEREKAKVIYDFCIENDIPITTHCNDGGFKIDTPQNIKIYTSPERWKTVLVQEKYEKLKINFAHFGGDIIQHKHKKYWYKKVVELINRFDNVYTDFSCLTMKIKAYKKLAREIKSFSNKDSKLSDRILFGSDFPMCLLFGSDSYMHYLENFRDTKHIKDKINYCSINPERFLFGKATEQKSGNK